MDLRWLLVIALITGIVGFLLGRRTSPGGRAVHRLQRAVDAKQQELNQHQADMRRFVSDMQLELDHVSTAYRDLQTKLRTGAEYFAGIGSPAPIASKAALTASPDPLASRPVSANTRPALAAPERDERSPEWSARLAGSWAGISGGPSLASAAACPLPDQAVLEAPKDYPASRRGGKFDEHSYA